MIDIVVPKWGLTVEEAEVVDWVAAVGASVAEGEEILELESDKTTGFVESPAAGVLVEVLVGPGDIVVPGQVVGRIQAS